MIGKPLCADRGRLQPIADWASENGGRGPSCSQSRENCQPHAAAGAVHSACLTGDVDVALGQAAIEQLACMSDTHHPCNREQHPCFAKCRANPSWTTVLMHPTLAAAFTTSDRDRGDETQ